MRHKVDRRKFGRRTDHRMAMFTNMAASLLLHERIETTLHKAKDLRRIVERLVTKGKNTDSLHARRLVYSKIKDKTLVKKLFEDFGPRFKTRNGGYTRILRKTAPRYGDSAKMAIIEFVDYKLPPPKKKKLTEEQRNNKELDRQAMQSGSTPKKSKPVVQPSG